MTSRGRYSQSNEWDSREDYNSSVYEQSYMNDDSSDDNLDHSRLYIRNIPVGLNEEGLRAAFAKFGTLVEAFLSKDPQKNYGLIKYETPGEAKFAMMKMNRTEPLKLQIYIANKKRREPRDWQDRNTAGRDHRESTSTGRDRSIGRDRSLGRDREESGSVVSRSRTSRVQDEAPNGENMDDLLLDDDYGFSDVLDPNLHLELENLKLEQLKVREEQLQCKQRVILLKQAERKPMAQISNRCILPDGKIVVRNTNDSSRDADVSFTAGAGDSQLPGLQREAACACVVCGVPAYEYCNRCGITPYCSQQCQRRDWHERHKAVCHNLARRTTNDNNNRQQQPAVRAAPAFHDVTDSVNPRTQTPVVAPLRRPHTVTQNIRREQNREAANTRNSYGNTSKASVKSNGSSGNEEKFRSSGYKPGPSHQGRVPLTKNKDPAAADQPAKPVFNKKSEPTPPTKEAPANTYPRRNMNNRPAAPAHNPEPAEEPKKVEPVTPAVAAAATAAAAAKQHNLVPKNYLLEKLSIGESVIMTVESKASDSRITRGDFVCVTLADAFGDDYNSLIEDLGLDCQKDEVPAKLVPGETISYFNPVDCGWYRARCLNPTTLALLDGGKIVTVTATDKCRKLPAKYEDIPEFCAVLSSKTVQLGASLNCKILSQTSDGYKISMADVEAETDLGEGELFRWLPTVEYQAATVPEVIRPPLTEGSKVLLVHVDKLDRVFVRPADSESQRKYNDVLQQVVLTSMKAKPLTEPPTRGQTVIGKFTDGMHYRALVRRTNVRLNKYQIEYAEFGNIENSTLENLYPCPSDIDLESVESTVSMIKLGETMELSDAAKEFVAKLVDEEELVLTLPEGQKTAPSGSEASLTIAKNKLDLRARLVEMSTPEWKKIEQKGGDVVELEHVMTPVIEYTTLPAFGCTIEVLDISALQSGSVCGYDRSDPHADYIFKKLTDQMAEYCNSELGKQPYLPKAEELCIAQLPPYPQWFRAIFLTLVGGPGSSEAKVCYLDYGNISTTPVNLLRKMMPEFMTGHPAMGLFMEIRDFPKDPTDEMLTRAIEHMKIDEEGRGTLKVSNCVKAKTEEGVYYVDAPELIAAMKG